MANGGKSTFFSKDMSPQDVVNAINEAYEKRTYFNGNKYIGQTKDGMKIQMFINNKNKIISAYPME